MPDKSQINVFISSTKEDLLDFREAARDAVLSLGCYPAMMDYWPAMDATAVKLCIDKVDSSDIYIGIFAHRYGYCPTGSKISITEMEFDRATEKGKPRLCFLVDEKVPWTPGYIEDGTGKKKLQKFKKRIDKSLIRATFKTPDGLKASVLHALQNALSEIHDPKPSISCNLVPEPPDYFAGRADMIEMLQKALGAKDGTAVAITALKGIGGMGKTTLAKALAHRSADRFGLMLWAELGEQWREDLEPGILQGWARALGDREFTPGTPVPDMIGVVREIVAKVAREQCGAPVLLIIDDVWPHTLECARQLRDAMPPGTRVLVTTRSEDMAARLVIANVQTLREMSDEDGAALIAELLRTSYPRIDEHTKGLEELSNLLGGHPLSLQLAARQLRRNFQPRKLIEMIDKFRKGIESGTDFHDLKLDAGDRKVDSLSVTLAQTLNNLSDQRQAQFRALGVLPMDLSFRAAHIFAIWSDEDRNGLDDLVAEGLLTPVLDREDQYTQHRLLRAYARALLRAGNELVVMAQRHHNYLIDLARNGFRQPTETWWQLDDDLTQIRALGNELVVLLAGTSDSDEQDEQLRMLSERSDADAPHDLLETCEKFSSAIYMYILSRYVGREGRRWLWAGLASARVRDTQHHINLFIGSLGSWHAQRNDKHMALIYHELSLQGYIAQGNKRAQVISLNNVGGVYSDLEDKTRALDYYQQALTLSLEVGDKRGQATSLNSIGGVYSDLEDKTRALDYYQQALTLSLEVGDKGRQATILNNIGSVYSNLGDKTRALDYHQQALPLRIEVGDPNGESITRFNMARCLWDQGESEIAIDQMQKARDLKVRMGLNSEKEDAKLEEWRSGRS